MSTKIEWTDKTWNPWWGCDKIAPECANCYAAVFAGRGLHAQFAGVAARGEWTGLIARNSPKARIAPLTWSKPCRVFTCSMSDFWHSDVPLEWLAEALDVIDRTPHLTYQILTKRPGMIARKLAALKRGLPRNTWLGFTCGHTDSMPGLKPLLRINHPIKFLSCEPLLTSLSGLSLDGIGWVIGGGESGNRARVGDPAWMRELRDLCITADVPFFLKQWGTWPNNPTDPDHELDMAAKGGATLDGRLWREFPTVTPPARDPKEEIGFGPPEPLEKGTQP